ncbi:monovalent cation:H+ antiporter, CPA1 (nhx1) [Sorochytrium milnesiophthora]
MTFSTAHSSLLPPRAGAPHDTPLPEHEELLSSRALLLLTALLVITLWTSYFLQRHRVQIIHESVVAIILGSIVGLIVQLSSFGHTIQDMVTFKHTYFFNLLLPPIILNSGYELREDQFFLNLTPIATFAFAGTFTSIMVIGLLSYMTALIGLTALSFVESLMLGCILSSTDPVTVLAIFTQLRVDPKLYSIIFGESILNDSVAIVMFSTLQKYVSQPFTAASFANIFGVFLAVFGGSLFIGVAIGLLCALMLKHSLLHHYPGLESCIISLIAYMSYIAAQSCEMSGIVALLFNGITLKHYGFDNMSLQARQTTTYLFGVLSQLSENFIFIYLGITLFTQTEDGFHAMMILSTLLFVLVARYTSVFPFARLINAVARYRNPTEREPLPHNQQVMLWWAGLRGAVSFALSLEVSSPNKLYIRTTTLIIVIITIVFFGGTVPQALRQFRIPSSVYMVHSPSSPATHSPEHPAEFASAQGSPPGSPTQEETLIRYFPVPVATSANWAVRIDQRYLRPFFCRPTRLMRQAQGTQSGLHSTAPLPPGTLGEEHPQYEDSNEQTRSRIGKFVSRLQQQSTPLPDRQSAHTTASQFRLKQMTPPADGAAAGSSASLPKWPSRSGASLPTTSSTAGSSAASSHTARPALSASASRLRSRSRSESPSSRPVPASDRMRQRSTILDADSDSVHSIVSTTNSPQHQQLQDRRFSVPAPYDRPAQTASPLADDGVDEDSWE